MALKYLAGAFDNYWHLVSSYFVYMNSTMGPSGKWQWLPTDFDGTFGNGAPFLSPPLLQELINGVFEQVLKELTATAFKPKALVPRIQAYNKMLSDDAKWDIGLKRHSDDPAGLADRVPLLPKNAGTIDNNDDENENCPNGDKTFAVGSSAAPSQGVYIGVLALAIIIATVMAL
ncbi:hypothetical protein BGX30_004265 [Mortierella sp. GBA39]|nr:hypothetical protein BGX30_004265 [Mortierella sp. GBA39]